MPRTVNVHLLLLLLLLLLLPLLVLLLLLLLLLRCKPIKVTRFGKEVLYLCTQMARGTVSTIMIFSIIIQS